MYRKYHFEKSEKWLLQETAVVEVYNVDMTEKSEKLLL